jgi:TRAP-type C4-dicarboxylate transport system substrate-binding protein
MQHRIRSILALAAIVVMSSSGAKAETLLRFNNFVPRTTFLFQGVMEPWAKSVEKVTQGRVKIEFTASGIGSPPAQFDLVQSGAIDLALGLTSYTPDRIKLTQLAELPLMSGSSEVASVALSRVYDKYFASAGEFKGVKLLGFVVPVPGHIFTVKGPQKSLADFKGLKLRVAGPVPGAIAEALGAVPVAAPGPKSAELLNSRVIDGSFFDSDGLFNVGIQNVVKYGTIFPDGLFSVVFYIAMNENAWNSLSEQDRAAIESVSSEAFSVTTGKAYDRRAQESLKELEALGLVATPASEDMIAKVKDVAVRLEKSWVATAKSDRNVDGDAALKMFKDEIASYRK